MTSSKKYPALVDLRNHRPARGEKDQPEAENLTQQGAHGTGFPCVAYKRVLKCMTF